MGFVYLSIIKSIEENHNITFETIQTEVWFFFSTTEGKMCPKGPKIWPFGSLFASFLVTLASQNDYKGIKLVENERFWCLTTVSIKIMTLIA